MTCLLDVSIDVLHFVFMITTMGVAPFRYKAQQPRHRTWQRLTLV